MITSPVAARMVLVSRAHLFKPTYPRSKERMIGPEAIFFHQGAYHASLKKLVQAALLPCAIKGSVSEIEQIVLRLLPTWENSSINTLQEMKRVKYICICQFCWYNLFWLFLHDSESFGILEFVPFLGLACQFAFDVAMISAFGNNRDFEMEGIKHLYQCLEKGYNSMPLDLPGTPFHKAMKVIYKKIYVYILFLWSTQFSKFNQFHWTLDVFNFFTTALEFKTCHKLTLIWS